MMLPGLVTPLFTQYAPHTTTAVSPRFNKSCIIGFVAAITVLARIWLRERFSLSLLKRAHS